MTLTLALSLWACTGAPEDAADPMAAIDSRYTEITKNLAIADRDTHRNKTNKQARALKVEREQERVAFFQDRAVIDAIERARNSQDPAVAYKGEAYWRHAVYVRSWTEEEKELETELLADIEAARSEDATWTGPDGSVINISGRWASVARRAHDLDPADRADLASAWSEQAMAWMDEDLTKLIKLRNQVARREGFQSYWELSLYHRGLDPAEVEIFLTEIEGLVAPFNTAAAQKVASAAESSGVSNDFANAHWLRQEAGLVLDDSEAGGHYDGDLAEERVTASMNDMGFTTDGIQVYTGPDRYVRSGAYSFAIAPPEYLAVVVSIDSRWSTWPYEALAHEIGRALWWRSLPEGNVASPVLWEPPAPWFEGFGQIFDRLLTEPAYSEKYVPELPEELRELQKQARVQDTVNVLTWYLGSTRVEKMMYESPGDWAALTTEAAAVDRALRAQTWDGPVDSEGRAWSTLIESGIMLHYPGYVQNFLYQYAVETTIYDAITDAVGEPVSNPRVGPWLVENLIHKVGPDASFEKVLSDLSGGQPRTAALKRYLESGG